jgi:hypothetical protein
MQTIILIRADKEQFDESATHAFLASIANTSGFRGSATAAFECRYTASGDETIVRLSSDLKRISIDGLGIAGLTMVWQLRHHLPPLRVFDSSYSFDIFLHDIKSYEQLVARILSK